MHFHLSTDKPQLLKLKQSSLPIPAGEARYIGLSFLPTANNAPPVKTTTKLLIFVNNDEDKNEECMEITVIYTDADTLANEGL